MEGGPPCFPPGFTCPAVLGRRPGAEAVRVRGSHPVPPAFPRRSAPVSVCDPHVGAPTTPAGLALPPVWPDPLSLAATRGVSVDFSSSGYLDVSVPRVVLPAPMCSGWGYPHCCGWVRPFGDPRVEGCVLLAGDYRSLPRPSSAPCAKASAVRPWYLAGPLRARGISTCR